MAKTKTTKATSEDHMDSEVNPLFTDDLLAKQGTQVFGHPGIMKSGPNAGQMAEDPTAPKRMVGADRGKKTENKLVGRTIVRVRRMEKGELEDEGWEPRRSMSAPLIIELDNGTSIYASRDDEGNGPGVLFGYVDDERARFEEES